MLCIKMRWVSSTCAQFIFFLQPVCLQGSCVSQTPVMKDSVIRSLLYEHTRISKQDVSYSTPSLLGEKKDQSRYKANRIDPMPSFPPQAPMHQSLTESLVGEARCGGCSNIKGNTAFTPILMRSHWEPHQQSRSIMLSGSNEHLRRVWRGCASKEWHWRRYPKIRTPWSGPEQSKGKNYNVKTPTGCGPHP